MAVEIEIDSPIPGDIVGPSFTVFGTYTLTRDATAPPAPARLVGTITVTILRDNGSAFSTGGAGSDTMFANPQVLSGIAEGSNQPWSFTFLYNMFDYNNFKIDARLTPSSGATDTDLVEGVDIGANAGTE